MFIPSPLSIRSFAALALALFTSAAWAPQPAAASDYQVVSEDTQVHDLLFGKLHITETVIQDGPMPINRFTMTRVRRSNGPVRGSLLLLPSLGNSFAMYLIDEGGDVTQSFAAVFARLGYDVWGYSPRETGIVAGECAGPLDCTPVLGWSMQTTVDDVGYIRGEIQAAHPGKRPAVGGLSLGALSAIAVVNQDPDDYAGLLAWEGSLVSDDPGVQAHNQVFCDQFTGMVNAGLPVDDQGLPLVKAIAQLAETAPNDPFTLPAPLPPGLTNHQAFVLLLSTPNPLAPSPRFGFTTAAGDFMADQLYYANEQRLFTNMEVFNDVTSNRVNQDFHCSLAGVETAYTDNLANFTAPLLVIKAGQGFGPIMDELPGKVGSTSVTLHALEDFAHVDHFASPAHWLILELRIADWLRTEVF